MKSKSKPLPFEVPRQPAWQRRWKRAAIVLCFFLAGSNAALSDQLLVAGRNRTGVKIVGLEQGRLQFRAADGTLEQVWISDVDFLNVERGGSFADVNDAERYLSKGDPEAALVRYRRAQKTTDDFWPEYIEARILKVCDRPSLVDQAASSIVRLVRGKYAGPPAAARLIPAGIPARRDAKVVQALETLDSALAGSPSEEQGLPLEWFRYELLRVTGDARSATISRTVALRDITAPLRCERVYSIQFAALSAALPNLAEDEGLSGLDAYLRNCPDPLLSRGLILKGETLLRAAKTSEDLMRASWPFLRVAIHMPDDELVPEALCGAAQALERLSQLEKAAALLEESLGHKQIANSTRQKAEAALARLQAHDERK